MNWIQFWPIYETILIVAVFAVIIWRLLRSAQRRAQSAPAPASRPITLGERIRYIGLRILRLLGAGLGAFLAIALVVMFERNLLTVYLETAPAPSQVQIPAELPFEVEEVSFQSEDGLRISGWYVPPENGALIILLHGYGGNRTAMIWHARQLTEAGYGVLMYDERASGESEGDYRSFGWEDPRDVGGALKFLNTRGDVNPHQIGISGCSIGGQIALQGAAYYPQIGAIWADGPSTIRAQDISEPTNPISAILVVSNYMLDWMFEVRLGIDAPTPMIEIIDDIAPRPIMLVGGGVSRPFIGSEAKGLQKYLHYAGENAELWVISEAFHCDGPGLRPDEYASRMIAFFDQAFDVERR
ncbi:MAG: alpha/beta hydrolase [Anaerolineales bacterium]